jgi:hypothetical protein
MGYNATHIITNFERFAGQPDGYEPGKRGRSRERFPDGSGSSLYYARDGRGRVTEIRSYGSHFPLGTLLLHPSGRRRLWLLNGDRWPGGGFGRTNEHNDIMRMAAQASGTPWFVLPFSAMRAAGIDPGTIRVISTEPEHYTYEDHSAATLDGVPEYHRKRSVYRDEAGRRLPEPERVGGSRPWPAWTDDGGTGWTIQQQTVNGWQAVPCDGPAYQGELTREYEEIKPGPDGRYHWATERHWLGASVFRAAYRVAGHWTGKGDGRHWAAGRRWAYFVTAFDYAEPAPLWFMSELPRGAKPATVTEAVGALKPETVRDAEAAGISVLRQGDVFAVQAPDVTRRQLRAAGGEPVPSEPRRWGEGGGRFVNDSHTATEVIRMPDGTLYARGILRHRPPGRRPDHGNRELWDRKTWGRVVFNAQARSFDRSPRSWSRGGGVD